MDEASSKEAVDVEMDGTAPSVKEALTVFLVENWGRYESVQTLVDKLCEKFNVTKRNT